MIRSAGDLGREIEAVYRLVVRATDDSIFCAEYLKGADEMVSYNDQQHQSDEYPTIAGSEDFEIWEDREDDAYVIAFNLNGVTITVDREEFGDFAQVVARAAEHARSQGMS
jgi:hypothetical protein